MSSTLALLAILAIVMVGVAVIWANPARLVNRVFFSFSVHAGLWLLFVHIAVASGEQDHWVRLASALGASITPHMWLLKQAILTRERFWRELSPWKYAWFGSAAVLVALCYTDWYIRPVDAEFRGPHFGPAYFVNTIGILILYGVLWHETVRQIKRHTGLHRLELQILLLGGTITAFGVILLMALRAILHSTWPIRLQPFVVLLLWLTTVVAITTHRIFNARQIILVATQKFTLVGVAALVILVVDRSLEDLGMPAIVALFLTAAVALWFAALMNKWLDRLFHFYPHATSAREAAFAAARETRIENLEAAFSAVLKGWGQTEHAVIYKGARDSLSGGGIEIEGNGLLMATMRALRWATPERLARERPTPGREVIGQFLKQNELGVLAIAEGPTLQVLVGVGVSASRVPFTYPQIIQLIELASIIENAFERAHFSVKAQHAEQLATVGLLGASLAHEIRNPLVSIKTFVQLLPQHHQDAAFRDKFFRLIGDEITRIDQLTEQLLDLASPRTYIAQMVELHPLLRQSIDLVAAKAVHRNVQFVTDFQAMPDKAFTDASAAKQVMLNLCFNAIQAVEAREGERWVKISTRNLPTGAVEMSVEDNGPGISPEIRPRLFEPFQTTKSSGFGLGLAICSNILSNLHATISVDPPASGRGAAFRVTFPCQPLSS